MTNEEKAKEIANDDTLYCNTDENSKIDECYISAMVMANFKDSRPISKLGGWHTVMKKIMFNDKYGLTAAVLAGTKTQTRRIVSEKALAEWNEIDDGDEYSRSVYCDEYDTKMRNFLLKYAPFKVGEVVAIAQSYFDIKTSANSYRPPIWEGYKDWHEYLESLPTNGGGYYNKMFVRAELMPHKIEITGIQVQRLQDISDEDCLAEGITKYADSVYTYIENGKKIFRAKLDTPRKAYAALIDNINGKGTWEDNPWVFVYEFKLIKK